MKKRIVTLLLVAAMTGSMVVGCGSNSSSDTKSETKTDGRRIHMMKMRWMRLQNTWQI